MENRTNTIEKRQNREKLGLLENLKEMPIIQIACKKSGTSRATFYRWRKEDSFFSKQVEDAISQGIEYINDMSESQLIILIKEKKMPAIALWLKHNHPNYGAKTQAHIKDAATEELSPEEEKIFIEALELSSGKKLKEENYDGDK